MKNWITALCAASTLLAQEVELTAPIVTNEPIFELAAPQISSDEMELPAPKFDKAEKKIFWSVSLSYLFPGMGHAYLGDWKTASSLAGFTGASIGMMIPRNEALRMTGLVTLQSTWSYGLYAAYRDTRNYNGNSGYKYKMPNDSFADLTYAPFRWKVMKKPEVWGGLLGALAIASTVSYFAYPQEVRIKPNLATMDNLSPAIALPVGIGEESLFRGFMQSSIAEATSPWGGIAVSSLVFGAAHIPNAMLLEEEDRWRYYAFSLPLITSMGAYFGWMTHKNTSIQESVALHTWYDFVLFAASAWGPQAMITRRPQFALSVPF